MLETSKAVVIMLVFAILVQFLVDRVKDIVGEKIMGYVKAPVWAALLGVLFAFLFRLDVFAMFGYTAQLPAVAYIITGLILSAGAAPIHELIEKMRASRGTVLLPGTLYESEEEARDE
jgi:uncharacterized protein YqgC (DUF456 family)